MPASAPRVPTFVPHLEILPRAQRDLWPKLHAVGTLGHFVLYGGTAIALRLSHRASVDFDFFSDQPLDRGALYAACPFLAQATVLQDEPDAFTALVASDQAQDETVKLSFFGGITFGRVGVPELTIDGVIQVASPDDLLATKLKVLLQRVEAKDYLDIAALLASGVALDRGLAGARALYGPAFQPSECLKALVYFEGGDLDTLPLDLQRTLINAAAAVGRLPDVILASRSLAFTPQPS